MASRADLGAPFRDETEVAIAAAARALAIARERAGADAIVSKGGRDLATAADVAEPGCGAWRVHDGARRRLATSEATHTVIVEDGKSRGARRERAARFAAAAIRADRWDLRALGTTLSSPCVAAGRVAAYAVFFVPALHAAAGSLLIAEAGGCVSDLDGRPWSVTSDSLVGSATRRLHDELLDLAGASRS